MFRWIARVRDWLRVRRRTRARRVTRDLKRPHAPRPPRPMRDTRSAPQIILDLKGPRSTAPSPRALEAVSAPIPGDALMWVERELRLLNRRMVREDRPEYVPAFLQPIPRSFSASSVLTPEDVAEAASQLVECTSKRIGRWEVPFRKPRAEFTVLLPKDEPAHIEFGEFETLIRIHPAFAPDSHSLAAVLCHELAHFIKDHNDVRRPSRNEEERITDLLVFRCGQGRIYLAGVHSVTWNGQHEVRRKLGYLSVGEMAYAHVRCAAQHRVAIQDIECGLDARARELVHDTIEFLSRGNGDAAYPLAEVLVCPSDHVLRVPVSDKGQHVRCAECGWEQEVWIHSKDRVSALIGRGIQYVEAGDMEGALKRFREAQEADEMHTMAYCWAARCLQRMGRHQDAIREVRKILTKRPEDIDAQEEMRTLLYR